MKKISYFLSVVIMMTLAMTSCTVGDNPATMPEKPTKKARLTIMYYGTIGDANDSEAEDMWRIAQKQLKGHDDVRMFVCWKYAKPKNFGGKYAEPGDLVMFELTDSTDLSKIGVNYGKSKPEQAMYDEALMTEYINYAAGKAPAENYCLLMFGHGAGFDATTDYEKDLRKKTDSQQGKTRGLLYDEWLPLKGNMASSDALNMYEMMRAINKSNVPHFNLILFYDCLMGNVESLYDLNEMTDYMVVSEHTMIMNNIPFEQFMKAFAQQENIEAACRTALANIPKEWDKSHVLFGVVPWNGDLKLIKCSEMKGLLEPAKKLSARLRELYPTNQEKLDSAMVKTYQVYNHVQFYDFADYAHKVAEETQDEQLKQISQEIDDAFNHMILARREVHGCKYGDLPQFTLSVVLNSQATYQKTVPQGYTFKEAYEYTNWHLFTDWGLWLETNQQEPKDQNKNFYGQPVGQIM